MRLLNWFFTLSSLTALLVIIERLSFTGNILLQPHSHITLHYLIQGPILITVFIIISVFVMKEITSNFSTLKTRMGFYLLVLFVAGAYLYGMGEGWHEVSSFTLNQHCDVKNVEGDLCGGLFINDYYTGNILFFIGAIGMAVALLFLEKMNPSKPFDRKNIIIALINSVVYAFTFFAYAAFDVVNIGLYSTAILMIIADLVFFSIRKKWKNYPYITYSAFAYSLATIASLMVRMLK